MALVIGGEVSDEWISIVGEGQGTPVGLLDVSGLSCNGNPRSVSVGYGFPTVV